MSGRDPEQPRNPHNRGKRLGDLRSLGELMGATLGKARLGHGIQKVQALLLWPQAVGPDIARMTRPRSHQGGVLYVEVPDSMAAHHLSMQRHHFLQRLNQLLGGPQVTDIRFSVGQVTAAAAGVTVTPLPPPDRARAAALTRGVPADVQPAALAAAEAVTRARRWREQQGWLPCPVCAEPSKQRPCRDCQLSLEDPNVRRAAQLLTRDPDRLESLTATLGFSGCEAARFLALCTLREQMELLAVECVRAAGSEPYLDFLLEQSWLYLSLTCRKPRTELSPADRSLLPPRTLQALSGGRRVKTDPAE
ncbi:DUF721 domain-containing protein [Deinococcus lacus]|uniref:DUF721 domain-containing protein n=1 Tax=Deinococcus lacus TaxID=392561 RepID=A0ABW1YAT1_9DEIO